jgi:protease II
MRQYLAAERAYYEQQMAHTAGIRDRLAAEMSARVAPASESVSWRRGNFHYFTQNGLAWSADAGSLLYTVTDAAYRPHQVWRHAIGTDPAQDVLVFEERDERFEVTVRATRSGAYIFVETASRDTTETLVIPAAEPGTGPFVLRERRKGVEYRADHGDGPDGGEFYLVTNDGAAEFRLLRGPATPQARQGPWTEVIPGSDGTRLVSCEVFSRHLVVTQRRGGGDPVARAQPPERGAAARRCRRP